MEQNQPKRRMRWETAVHWMEGPLGSPSFPSSITPDAGRPVGVSNIPAPVQDGQLRPEGTDRPPAGQSE